VTIFFSDAVDAVMAHLNIVFLILFCGKLVLLFFFLIFITIGIVPGHEDARILVEGHVETILVRFEEI
jgi:hypothetical protein